MRDISLKYDFKLISKDNSKAFNPRTGRCYLDPKYKAFEDRVRWETKAQYHGKPLEGDLRCEITACFQDKRRCDVGNLSKSLLDALQGLLYKNDKQIVKLTVSIGITDEAYFVINLQTIN